MSVLEQGEPGDVLVLDVVALGTKPGHGGVEAAGVPQHDGVEDQAERGELVLSYGHGWKVRWPMLPTETTARYPGGAEYALHPDGTRSRVIPGGTQ